MIVNGSAGAALLQSLAIVALIGILNTGATGIRVAAEHQQHRKNQFHLTLP